MEITDFCSSSSICLTASNFIFNPIFDKEKEQQRIKEAQLIGEIGSQMSDILCTEGKIAGEKAKTDPAALKAAREQLTASGRPYTEEDVRTQAYLNAMQPWGTGSAMQQAVQAATAAVQGLAGGNIGQAISGAAAPYLAEVIHEKTASDQAAKAMAHAVVGAVTSWAAGNSAAAGAAGAVTGEVMAKLVMAQLYPGKAVSDLTETEKQTISALGTLAAGLAGGITGDSTADAVAGAQAGKNSSENNALGEACVKGNPRFSGMCGGGGGNANIIAGAAVASGAGSDEDEIPPNVAGNMTDAEKAEIGGAGSGTPGGWEPQDEENARKSEALTQQQNHFDELSQLYDKSNPAQNLKIEGQTIRQSEMSNSYGTTKVFESQNLTDQQIHKYAQELAGNTPLKEVRPGIYTAELENGTSITLRDVSSSKELTGARWTIDIRGNQQLADVAHKYGRQVEIKFK